MYSVYKLNKQGDNIQPWHTPFPIWNQSVVPCPVLTVASWPAYRFLKRQVRWSGIPISFRIFHSLLWSTQSKAYGIVNKAEIDVFLELSCFFDDPADAGNLISAQWCSTVRDPVDYRLPGSSVHRVFQPRVLEWVAISSSRVSLPRDQTHGSCVSCVGRQVLYHWATWEALIDRDPNPIIMCVFKTLWISPPPGLSIPSCEVCTETEIW